MIEFKAECGHTIRAKDEDEGKVVRCSYCGREAQVPQDDQDELDMLFSEVESSEAEARGPAPKKVRRKPRSFPAAPSRRSDEGFNPLAVALKMSYAAGILIVLIFVSKYAYNYWTSPDRKVPEIDRLSAEASKNAAETSGGSSASSGRKGLLTTQLRSGKGGLYVSSVPPEAMVRVRKPESGQVPEIFRDPKADRYTADVPIELDPGVYEVGVAVRVNDAALRDYPDYIKLRRQIDQGAPTAVLREYFLPDQAAEVATVELPNQPVLLVRKYTREVMGTEWTPLTALFLPDRAMAEQMRFLPRRMAYGFEDEDVEFELEYYGVRQADRKFILDALHRTGMVMYPEPGGAAYRCFIIHLLDGSLTSRLYHDDRRSGGAASAGNEAAGPARPGGRAAAGSP